MSKKIEALTKQLEEGVKEFLTSEKYASYLRVMSAFHTYSFSNSLLIAMQKPEAQLVAGYKTWQSKFNRHVKHGAHAISIIAPCPITIHKKVDDSENDYEEVKIIKYRAVNVFDVSDTEGEPLPKICNELTGQVDFLPKILEKVKEIAPVPIVFETITNGSNGYYSFSKQKIAIKEGMSDLQTIKTVFHELAHSLLHSSEEGKKKDRQTKEVEAESVSYVVANCLGLDTSDYSFEYIGSWTTGREVKELQDSMATIQKTAQMILDKLKGDLVNVELR
ncbi:protein of unknown function [Lachnospiraceae bacterium KHCPX20]|nr:protein of unknown function [Lachnospiraceae bacterium KHCPX20]